MNRKHVNLTGADQSIHDPIGPQNDFTNLWVVVLSHGPTRLRKVLQAVNRPEKPSDHDCRVVRRIGFNERVDSRKIVLRALSPLDGHAE